MSQPWANGVLLVEDGTKLLVNDIVYGTTTIYDVHPATKKLRHARTIVSQFFPVPHSHSGLRHRQPIGATPDNLSLVPHSGDVIVSGMVITYTLRNVQIADQLLCPRSLAKLLQRGQKKQW